jgi:uncharacterized protein YjlB
LDPVFGKSIIPYICQIQNIILTTKYFEMILASAPVKIPHFAVSDNGIFPNSILPILIYKSAFTLPNDHAPGIIEEVFDDNQWTNSWRNGIYSYHHYHSTTHEVLGIYSGECHVQLGGDSGIQLQLVKGDVLVIPAGVSHKNLGSSLDFKCIGAYPDGRDFDINLGKEGERPGTDDNISKVPIPKMDPLYGSDGCLHLYWKP